MPSPEFRDDEIGRKLREAELNGELKSARGYGQPLPHDHAWEQTPDEWRMPFKILKDAGAVPPEVELLKQRAALRAQVAACTDPAEDARLRERLAALALSLSLRLESLGRSR